MPRSLLVLYWTATALVTAELAVGGLWDVARIPLVRAVVVDLGYPTYVLVLLGVWKMLGAAALLAPRRGLLKEWAYAGAFFAYTGALISHVVTGADLGELAVLVPITILTVASWSLRPADRRVTVDSTLVGPTTPGEHWSAPRVHRAGRGGRPAR